MLLQCQLGHGDYNLEKKMHYLLLVVLLVGMIVSDASAAECEDFVPFGQPVQRNLASQSVTKDAELTVICHAGQVVGFNPNHNVPDWVAHRIRREELLSPAVVRKDAFRSDPQAPTGHRVEASDYQRTGYDRGHMAPAGAMRWSKEAMSDSFFMTNMAPQVGPGFNRGIWRSLERKMRQWACERGTLYVVTGPLYEGRPVEPLEFDGNGDGVDDNGVLVDVPSHFYKLAVDPIAMEAIAFILKNQKTKSVYLPQSLRSIREIEARSGFDFLSGIWDGAEYVIENHVQPELWENPKDDRCRGLQ